jgi:hypothetical protein
MQHVQPYPMFTPTSPVNAGLSPTQFYPAQPHPHQQSFHHFAPPHFQQPNGGGGGGGGHQPYGFLPSPLVPGTQEGVPMPSSTEHHHHHHTAQPYRPPLNPSVDAFSPRSSPISPRVHFKPPAPASTDAMGANTASPSASAAPKPPGGRPAAHSRAVAPPVASGGAHLPPPVLLGHNNPRWRGNTHHSAILRTSRNHSHHLSSSSPNTASSNSRNHRPSGPPTIHVPHHTALGVPMRSLNAAAAGGGGGQYGQKLGWPAGGAGVAVGGRKPTPEANIVDVDKIEKGLDTRTTVMLKNVPNKVSL